MTTVIAENRKTLRQPMVVQCGFRETTDEPTTITPNGELNPYEHLANINQVGLTTRVMDLSGDGFLNDGFAMPITTESDSGNKYGYISSVVASSDGSFSSSFGVTLTAATTWDYVTLELIDEDGAVTTQLFEPTWNGTTCTVTVSGWPAGIRCYITGVYLGKAWTWDQDNLVSVELDLRSVSTEVGGELEISTITISAYEPTDYADVIGRVPDGAPIWYTAGYDGDMSAVRTFYKTDNVEWENNVITITGEDATTLIESAEMYAGFYTGLYSDAYANISSRLRSSLAGITFSEVGTEPTSTGSTTQEILFPATSQRSSISTLTQLFRDENGLRVTYVDAGIPTLHFGNTGFNTWTIYADEIGELKYIVEPNYNQIEQTLFRTVLDSNGSMSMTVDAVKNEMQHVTFDKPCAPFSVSISPTPTTFTVLGPYDAILDPAATTTYTISAWVVFKKVYVAANSPYTYNNGEKGFTYSFDDEMVAIKTDDGALTRTSLQAMLDRSNIVYEFTYRGNPHMQPRDVINVELASWQNVETVIQLQPDPDLFPDDDIEPNETVYEYPRKLVKEWVPMTVDSIELTHEEGGTRSVITARKGVV